MTTNTIITRKPILQMDLVNNVAVMAPEDQTGIENRYSLKNIEFDEELKAKFFEQLDSFWHTEEDQLQLFCYFNDGTWFAQRNRQKYDFASESLYWNEYKFKGGTAEQAREVYELGIATFMVQVVQKQLLQKKKLDSLEEEHQLFEAKWLKRKREKRVMLSESDWHVLPDVPENYEGEKQRWLDWRAKIRSIDIPNPDTFDTPLDFMRTMYADTFPIDPKNYRKLYPNDMLEDGVTPAPAFMDPNDSNQWVSYDDDASSDYLNARIINRLIFAKQRAVSKRHVRTRTLEIIRAMRVEEVFPGFDTELFTDTDEE